MENDRGRNSISCILKSLPGDVVLITTDGVLLGRKGTAPDNGYTAWPYVSLFSGTGKACKLYWNVPMGCDPELITGPLELLLEDLIIAGSGYWFMRLLKEPADFLDFDSLPADIKSSVPLRLGALRIGEAATTEAVDALQALLPDLKAYLIEPGLLILRLPADQEMAQDWYESIMALLSEELMMDPLMLHGEIVTDIRMLHSHTSVLGKLCEVLHKKGIRGVQSLIRYLPELAVGTLVGDCVPLIKDLGRIIEPVLNDADLSQTADAFIMTNLSISETAQNLFLHRNTLVYRLGKIEKLTGLDLKRLDQAMAFILLKTARG